MPSSPGSGNAERPEAEAEPPPPLPPHDVTLDFEFDLTPHAPPPAAAPAEEEGAAAAEGGEGEAPPSPLDGTFFRLLVPAAALEEPSDEPAAHELAHPLSGEGAPESSSAAVTVGEAFVRWLAVEAQGALTLALVRRAADGGEEEALGSLTLDVAALLFGKSETSARFGVEAAAAAGGDGALPLPPELAGLLSTCAVRVRTPSPLLSPELVEGLNPTSVTLVRAPAIQLE